MKHIKKTTIYLLLFSLLVLFLTGCKNEKAPEAESTAPDSTTVETTGEEEETTADAETTEEPSGIQTRPSTSPNASPDYETGYTGVSLYEIGSTVWMQGIAAVTNTGEATLSLDGATFHLQNAAGETVASKGSVQAFPKLLAPGETGYFYMETTLSDVTADAQLSLQPEVTVSKSNMVKHALTVADAKLSTNALGDLVVNGTLENSTDQSFDNVYTATVLFNEEGNPIGIIASGATYSLVAGGKASLQDSAFALPDNITEDSVADFTVFAYAATAK